MSAREPVDVTNCDREPIHIPGSIQPHGVLVAFVEPSLEIVSASENCAELLGVAADRLVGATLDAIVDADAIERVRNHRSDDGLGGLDALRIATGVGGVERQWTALVHRQESVALLELEPVNAPRSGPGNLLLVGAAAQKLRGERTLVDACAIVADHVRRITGFDRVKVYRFAADWSGEVLAEARDDAMPSYLGLHFPASDIPAQARALYESNPVRLIADVHYRPSPLLPDRDPVSGGPLDLRAATLRSVSPIHLEYLRNMGVGASMSASILRDGRLWGLIACHHREPLLVDFERRQGCALLAQLLAARLDAQERTDRARHSGQVEALRANMLRAVSDGQSAVEALTAFRREWMQQVGASGFLLARPDERVESGDVPPKAFTTELGEWILSETGGEPLVADRLAALYPPAAAVAATASGVLAIPLSRAEHSYLMWFRPEQRQTVTWAGRPQKTSGATGDASRGDEPGAQVLHPRSSFDAWSEEVRGRASPWSDEDVAAALQLREILLDLIVHEKDELERQNLRLELNTRELETFIYVASHDIKEPLRQMEMLTSLLREHVRTDSEAEVAEYFREFKTVAGRLRALTDELADYAKLGRPDSTFAPVDLNDLLEEVLASSGAAIAAVGGSIAADRLPTVLGERAQLHQVFQNVLGNAVKYRATSRPLRVEVAARDVAGALDAGRSRPMTRIAVTDNGIGFEPKYAEKIFDAFFRLHSRDRYEGSGIGLAICRRIIERHGGRIEAASGVDRGTTFFFTLPLDR